MAKAFARLIGQTRGAVQLATALISNAYLKGFLEGTIYKGDTKAICVPGLNCYACPGALGSCPIGSLQAVLGSRGTYFSWYVGGLIVAFGALLGRLTCGWLCPFGFFQDLLYRVPIPKGLRKLRRLPGERYLAMIRHVLLVVMVILLPLFAVDFIGQGSPWFCTWVCPSGTLSGLLLLAGNESLREVVGWLFAWKNLILIVTILLSIIVYRPFCRYLCPLGALYGYFNPIALYRFSIDTEKCTRCEICQQVCKLDIAVFDHPNSSACIRCGDCIKACPHEAILHGVKAFTNPSASQNASGCPQ